MGDLFDEFMRELERRRAQVTGRAPDDKANRPPDDERDDADAAADDDDATDGRDAAADSEDGAASDGASGADTRCRPGRRCRRGSGA